MSLSVKIIPRTKENVQQLRNSRSLSIALKERKVIQILLREEKRPNLAVVALQNRAERELVWWNFWERREARSDYIMRPNDSYFFIFKFCHNLPTNETYLLVP